MEERGEGEEEEHCLVSYLLCFLMSCLFASLSLSFFFTFWIFVLSFGSVVDGIKGYARRLVFSVNIVRVCLSV